MAVTAVPMAVVPDGEAPIHAVAVAIPLPVAVAIPLPDGDPLDDFIASATFAGRKLGYKFTSGPKGLGYYRDDGSATTAAPPGAAPPNTYDPNNPELRRLMRQYHTGHAGCCVLS